MTEDLENLGIACFYQGDFASAIGYLKSALQHNPNSAEIYYKLARSFQANGDHQAALDAYQQAIKLNPRHAYAAYFFAKFHLSQQRIAAAQNVLQHMLVHCPDDEKTHQLASLIYALFGELDLVISHAKKASELAPMQHWLYSNYLYYCNFSRDYSQKKMLDLHRDFANHVAGVEQLERVKPKLPHQKIKLAYISSDFRNHSVAYFLEPLLIAHDYARFEIFLYSGVVNPDAITQRMQSYPVNYQSIVGLSTEQIVHKIKQDQIDILIELSGHTDANYLPVLMHRPAPVQITYLGYPNTTGVPAIDYKITDAVHSGASMQFTEAALQLPAGFHCYLPDPHAPLPALLPALNSKYFTFGCFNHLLKIDDQWLAMCLNILNQVSNSRIMFKAPGFAEALVIDRFAKRLLKLGFASEQFVLVTYQSQHQQHLQKYHEVDLALDTYPYNGTTTTCEALYMGVPVLTLIGDTAASRVGASLLTQIGRSEWIFLNAATMMKHAVAMAGDRQQLAKIRAGLRQEVENSSLMDKQSFTGHFESALVGLFAQEE